MVGRVFGKWTVVREAQVPDPKSHIYWECRCECGTVKPVRADGLLKGNSTQCKNCNFPTVGIDLTGRIFNKWTVLKEIRIPNQNSRNWECKCECGSIKTINSQSLRENKTTQCRKCSFHKHNMAGTPTYRIWAGLFTRCYNIKNHIYKYYGGRGIQVCERWKDFSNFYADMGERPKGLQLDRIDNDGHYSPDNCRWVTSKENNASNKGDLPDNMPGKVFGKWKVLERVKHKPNHWYYLCRCECDLEKIIAGGELRSGRSKQCMECSRISRRGRVKRYKCKQLEGSILI